MVQCTRQKHFCAVTTSGTATVATVHFVFLTGKNKNEVSDKKDTLKIMTIETRRRRCEQNAQLW